MTGVVATIAPVFLLIVIGFGFRRAGFPGDGFWAPAERLSYYVLLPALVIHTLASADLAGIQLGPLVATGISMAAAMTALVACLKPVLRIEGPAFTSFLQGTVRLNSFLGFAIALAFFGAPGLAVAAVFVSFMMPTVNVICIGALAAFGASGRPNWLRVPVQIATNPLILACVIGALLNVTGAPVPGWATGVFALFAKAALPVALLCVGAGIEPSAGRARRGLILLACGLKLCVMPAIAWGIAGITGLDGLAFAVAMMFAATPVSPAAYVLARQLGGDAALMAGITTAETALSAVTLSLVLAWLTGVALF